MQQPEVSVIVPVYNAADYLEQCLNTIIGQTLREIEILCIDDGSTDRSLEILEEYARRDPRIRLFHRECSSGSGAVPRNLGLAQARGTYVMFLDADDYFDPCLLEKLLAQARRTGAELVMCDNYVVSPLTGEVEAAASELHTEYLPQAERFCWRDCPKTIFQISNAAVWHKLILRDLPLRNGLTFQEGVPILDDVYFVNLLLILANSISILPERLVYYRANRPGSQTNSITRHTDSVFLAFDALNRFLQEHDLYVPLRVSLQNWTLATMGWWLGSVVDYDTYVDLFRTYQKCYFPQLHLLGLKQEEVNTELWGFYQSITERACRPSLIVILESILAAGSRIALYGAGIYGRKIYQAILSHGKHQLVLWCDKRADTLEDPRISTPVRLREGGFDALLIGIASPAVVREVRAELRDMGIPEDHLFEL